MGRLSTRWRRFWGLRPGELRPPVRIVGHGRTMGEPASGPHGRGWGLRHGRLGRRPAATESPAAEPAASSAFAEALGVVADEQVPEAVDSHEKRLPPRQPSDRAF